MNNRSRKRRPYLAFGLLLGVAALGFSPETPRTTGEIRDITLDSTVLSVTPILSNLAVPWDIDFGPDGWIWFTEQRGVVSRVNPNTGQRQRLIELTDVFFKRSTGLLGMTVGVDKTSRQTYVYLDYTYKKAETVTSKVVRYTFDRDTLVNPFVVLDDIPASDGHNGSRMAIAPDGTLIVSTGDATVGKNAQDKNSVSGKFLRINPNGSVPSDNPIPGSYVWSYGHRNSQGLCFSPSGKLYASEHGLANDDEINRIEKGRNYGWPTVTGLNDTPAEDAFYHANNVAVPLLCWTPTIAPAGIAFYAHKAIPEWRNSLIIGTLKECDIRVLALDNAGEKITREKIWADRQLGRLRDICVAPNGDVFVATSNRDWNPTCEGFPKPTDDQIIRLRRVRTLSRSEQMARRQNQPALLSFQEPGQRLYEQHCESCHKKKGEGLADTFPPLAGSEWIKNELTLTQNLLGGMSGKIQVKGKPYEGVMPAFDFLSNQELADVLTYIRQSFGNQESTITFKAVEKVRSNQPKK